jgi:hypothetical protein
MFYGIIVRMYFFDDKQHKIPHIHAECAEYKSVFNILDCTMLAGQLPPGKEQLVKAWIVIHREELLADWQIALNGEEPFRIDPLR